MDYVRHSTDSGKCCDITYRLMSDGILLQQTSWPRYSKVRARQAISKSSRKIAKVTTEIKANPDLLLTQDSKRRSDIPLLSRGTSALAFSHRQQRQNERGYTVFGEKR